MNKLILLRHGESVWNKENIFTGWTDVDLSERGVEEAREAGRLIREVGIKPDVAFASVLKRSIRTLFIVLEELGLQTIPIHYSWRLNERHYGALQGLNKLETVKKFGEEQVKIWRRSYSVNPPPLEEGDKRDAVNDPLYKDLKREEIPLSESLEDTTNRVMPYWNEKILPEILSGKNVLVSGHGSGVRSMVKYLDNMSDEAVTELNIPTGIPLIYEFDDSGKNIKHYYLGDSEDLERRIGEVKNQIKISN